MPIYHACWLIQTLLHVPVSSDCRVKIGSLYSGIFLIQYQDGYNRLFGKRLKTCKRSPFWPLSKITQRENTKSFLFPIGDDELKGTNSEQTRHQIRARQRFPPQILGIRKTPQCKAPRRFMYTEGMTGIEPASSVWKTEALPLSYIPARTR